MEHSIETHHINKDKTKVSHYHRDCVLADVIFEHLHRRKDG